jgi:hypothetical protein
MIIRRTPRLLLFAGALLSGLTLAPGARADFLINVNTTSIEGTQGFIDIQFAPGSGTPLATATITNFSTDAMFLSSLNGSSAGSDGGGSGTLPGPLSIINTGGALNDVIQPVDYGSYISFDVAFSGSLANAGSFGLTLYDGNYNTLLTTDPYGTVATINFDSGGNATLLTFPDANGNYDATATAVPEPSTWLLLFIGTAGIWVMRKRSGVNVCPSIPS